jgi:hypothetical protein
LPISHRNCVGQIKFLERERRAIESALAGLQVIYTGLFSDTQEYSA